jgi:hypothetical protein
MDTFLLFHFNFIEIIYTGSLNNLYFSSGSILSAYGFNIIQPKIREACLQRNYVKVKTLGGFTQEI